MSTGGSAVVQGMKNIQIQNSVQSQKMTHEETNQWAKDLVYLFSIIGPRSVINLQAINPNQNIIKTAEIIKKFIEQEPDRLAMVKEVSNNGFEPYVRCLSLPKEIACFSNVTQLDLRANGLENGKWRGVEVICPELAQLTNLESVVIMGDQFNKPTFPDGVLKCWKKVHLLILGDMNYIPVHELPNLQDITDLRLISCNLREFPSEILQLKKITFLDIQGNNIQQIPSEAIPLLKKITFIYIQGNNTQQIPIDQTSVCTPAPSVVGTTVSSPDTTRVYTTVPPSDKIVYIPI